MIAVSILTPTIPGREPLLAECLASVRAQTIDSFEHVVELDARREGCSVAMNRAAARANGAWFLPLADDDILLPSCLETLLPVARDNPAAIVYAPPLVWGEPQEWFTQAPPVIPSFALIPRDVWFQLGGYDERASREEDRKMWIAALAAGIPFVRADERPTWVYRLAHGGNKSFNAGVAA